MSVEENKAKILRAFELVNWGIVAALRELMTPGFVGRDPSGTVDRDKYVEQMAARLKAVPDARVTIDDIVAEGDTVAVQYTYLGTGRIEPLGIPGIGDEAGQTRVEVFRVANGKIQEGWSEANLPHVGREADGRQQSEWAARDSAVPNAPPASRVGFEPTTLS